MKRRREDDADEINDDGDEGGTEEAEPQPPGTSGFENGKDAKGEEDSDDEPVYNARRLKREVRSGAECPYLDTISRQADKKALTWRNGRVQNLDFDFEKCCSVSLSPVNVYACLVCGKYFQGRGTNTHAFTHALDTGHHMFMKLVDGRVYCLPEGYEVQDRSLDVIRFVLNPLFTPAEVEALDRDITWARALDGTEYMPGLVGLNNMKANDYANVVVQILARVSPIRDFFLIPSNYADCQSLLVQRTGDLLRKIWNPKAFKGQVSPHEFMQAVMAASGKQFTIDKQAGPVEFWTWLVNRLHADLTGGKLKKQSIISRCFQGELEITHEGSSNKAGARLQRQENSQGMEVGAVRRVPFMMLALDLPPAPLYRDALERNIIPQVPIFELLQKFNGVRVHDDIKQGRRRYRLTKLPQYLVLCMKRFNKNNFFLEKNPTIVNFPVKNLELRDVIPVPTGPATIDSSKRVRRNMQANAIGWRYAGKGGQPVPSKYDLAANVVHEGKAGAGTYRAYVHRKSEDTWYEVQDLRVTDILPQMVALSETYMQVYELKKGS